MFCSVLNCNFLDHSTFIGVQTRVLVTRNVDLTKESNCAKRDLLVDPDDGKKILLEIFDLFDRIQAIRVEEGGEKLGIEDICFKPIVNGPCLVSEHLAVELKPFQIGEEFLCNE